MTRGRPGRWLLLGFLVLASCVGGRGEGEVLVSAAASLAEAFAAMAGAFEDTNPYSVTLNLAASSALREQILAGAPSDLFAPAAPADMAAVASAGLVEGQARIFARSDLVIAVPPGNPARIAELSDLADPGLLIGLCAPGVPCGDLALEALSSAGVEPSVDTEEPDVRSLLTKVASGELDVGIVYRSLATPGLVERIEIPEPHNRVAEYEIAVLRTGRNEPGAAAFVDFVLSDDGAQVLRRHGFQVP